MSTEVEVDRGKLIIAKKNGDCGECGRMIVRGEWIYFLSVPPGPRHRKCVEGGSPPAPRPDAPRDARDDESRAAAAASSARDARSGEPGRLPFDPARDTEFGRAGDRDAARRELGQVLDLVIEAQQLFVQALQRIRRILD